MSTRCKIGLAMLSCVALGALASEALRAQARPPAYLIGQIDVSDPEGYAKEYLPRARAIIKSHGGRLIAAAGAAHDRLAGGGHRRRSTETRGHLHVSEYGSAARLAKRS